MEELKKYIAGYDLSQRDIELICDSLQEVVLPKGEFLVEQGKTPRNSAVILNGLMRSFCYKEDGSDPTGYFFVEGQYILDPFTFRQQIPACLSVQAITNCKLAMITYEEDKKLRAASPGWDRMTTDMLLRESMELANQKEMMPMNATERYLHFIEKYPDIYRRAPLQYVASYLGIAQPSLSRLRKEVAQRSDMKRA